MSENTLRKNAAQSLEVLAPALDDFEAAQLA
jgi:hypothetical protein